MNEMGMTGERARYASAALVDQMRGVANVLENSPEAEEPRVRFPNWAADVDEPTAEEAAREDGIRRAAAAILAERTLTGDEDVEPVSKWDLGALIHYIADMLEE